MFWIQSFYQANMNFIIRHSSFPQSYYSGSKVFTPDPKFLLWIQSYNSGSKVTIPDPKLFLRIQSYKVKSGSKVTIPDPKL